MRFASDRLVSSFEITVLSLVSNLYKYNLPPQRKSPIKVQKDQYFSRFLMAPKLNDLLNALGLFNGGLRSGC